MSQLALPYVGRRADPRTCHLCDERYDRNAGWYVLRRPGLPSRYWCPPCWEATGG